MDMLLIGILLGSIVGIVLGLTGAGGAIIAVPLLIFGLQLDIAEAVPISLLAVCLSATIGALIGLKQGIVRYRAAGLIAMTGSIVSPLGFWAAQKLPNTPLILLFSAVLIFVAVDILRKTKASNHESRNNGAQHPESLQTPCIVNDADGRFIWTWPCVRVMTTSGALTGLLSGLLGVGGGFVVISTLKKATYLHMQSILATSLAVVALVSAVGATSAVFLGAMNWPVAIPFVGGALAGMVIGNTLANQLDSLKLQYGFAWMAIFVALGLVVNLFF